MSHSHSNHTYAYRKLHINSHGPYGRWKQESICVNCVKISYKSQHSAFTETIHPTSPITQDGLRTHCAVICSYSVMHCMGCDV